MRNPENISSLIALKPNFIGFIFYHKSKRFITDFPKVKFPSEIKKVGVFVNEPFKNVIDIVNNYQLDVVQLHGDETPQFCDTLINTFREFGGYEKKHDSELVSESYKLEIIKAFSVDETFNFEETKPYENYCSYFLFDTKGKHYGGNGVKFNWEILNKYKGRIPFLLSGGISKNDVDEIKKIHHIAFKGVDINSGFEIEPGLKNIEEIKKFKNSLI